jgi:activator of HSP90 ATPase
MDSKKHTSITGVQANISRELGGKISAYDGYIDGENVELVQDKKIVQKWRGSDWPEGHYSTATFELEDVAEGTKLIFTQTSVPEQEFEMVSSGWYQYYWEPMKKLLEK